MNTVKHTPGPWSINHPKADSKTIVLMGCEKLDGVKICEMYIPYRNTDDLDNKINRSQEAMCNAKLIAAAPELLKELMSAHNFLSHYITQIPEGEWKQAIGAGIHVMDKAIKKATE